MARRKRTYDLPTTLDDTLILFFVFPFQFPIIITLLSL